MAPRTYALRCGLCTFETDLYGTAHRALDEYMVHAARMHPFAMGYIARLRLKIGGDG